MNEPNSSTVPPEPTKPGDMGILEHLGELRKILIRVFLAVIVCSFGTFYYSIVLFNWLSKPYRDAFPNHPLIGTGPAEAFTLKITVAVFAGLLIALPYIFYQIWKFIVPGLLEHEQKLALPFVTITTLCFLLGIIFCFYGVLPFSFAFFKDEYESIGLTPQIRMSEHLSLTVQALVAFGVIFEFPILAFILGRLGVLHSSTLIGGYRYVVVAIFVVAAVLTPPDVISQMLMVAPMVVLYAVSILILKISERRGSEDPRSN